MSRNELAKYIATYTGMFSAFTLAFLAGFIPQELSRKRVLRKIRELLLQRAHYAWWTQRELIAADSESADDIPNLHERPQQPEKTSGRAGTPTKIYRKKVRFENEAKPCRRKKRWRQL
jgi:hypothetical protein